MPRILLAPALWLAAPAALAHAVLVETTPPADAALAEAPDEIILRFSEPVVPVTVRLLGADGTAVAEGAAARDTSLILPLQPLERGTYILTSRAISADSHPVGGAFRFAVGTGGAPAEAPALHATDWTAAAAVHRALYLALMSSRPAALPFSRSSAGGCPRPAPARHCCCSGRPRSRSASFRCRAVWSSRFRPARCPSGTSSPPA